ncbi:MAG: macro domain-containing protein [Lachnospiraceae bacterium]|nr:macro domain-containing protein [Clostridia bacterium]MBQ7724681.1 macro domain-containing protein [Lachnospiraceae bacterium]
MNSSIEIKKRGITSLGTDAIVNAANKWLQEGGGVCGIIFKVAGSKELQIACDRYGYCDTGDAVITPAFNLRAKYIIHAVGPVWQGGDHGEEELLKSAYRRSLELAVENGCTSIGFPLISAGIFMYPLEEAWKVALTSCKEFIDEHKDTSIRIVFGVIDDNIHAKGNSILQKI